MVKVIPAPVQVAFKDFKRQCLVASEGESADYDQVALAFAMFIVDRYRHVWDYILHEFSCADKPENGCLNTLFLIQRVHPYLFQLLTFEYLMHGALLEISPDRHVLLHNRLVWPRSDLTCVTLISGRSDIHA